MIGLLESKREAIAKACAHYGVTRLHAFGSRVLLNREIDLVMTGAIKNPYIARDIERAKQLLYGA